MKKAISNLTAKYLLVCLLILIVLSSTSCRRYLTFFFEADYDPALYSNEIMFEGWKDGGIVCQRYSDIHLEGTIESYATIRDIHIADEIHREDTNQENNAIASLRMEYDSVRFTRLSDSTSTVTYRYDAGATEAQRFFFEPRGWTKRAPYTFIFYLSDEMFE